MSYCLAEQSDPADAVCLRRSMAEWTYAVRSDDNSTWIKLILLPRDQQAAAGYKVDGGDKWTEWAGDVLTDAIDGRITNTTQFMALVKGQQPDGSLIVG